jgi:predicted Zn-ribbon and HTH transcriptional regulator
MQFEKAINFIIEKQINELPLHLSYHNIQHTKDVYKAVETIAAGEDIRNEDLKLLLTAAAYHDCGFLETREGHEMVSCRIARETLPNYDYSEDQIKNICGMITATHLPQSPKNHLECILADADLDYLGREDFFLLSERLYREVKNCGELINDDEWNHVQVDFMLNHHYFTQTSINLRADQKQVNLDKIKIQSYTKATE